MFTDSKEHLARSVSMAPSKQMGAEELGLGCLVIFSVKT